jgi:flagellar protein FlbD
MDGFGNITRTVKLIIVTRLGGPEFALNPDLIERAESTPDTVVTLVGGNRYVIRETLDELIDLIRNARAEVIALAESITSQPVITARTRRAPILNDVSLTPASSVVPMRPREK